MHIFIDIRTSKIESPIYEMYGKFWGELWKKYHTEDTITYIIDPSQHITKRSLSIPCEGDFFGKPLTLKRVNEIYRYMNFSLHERYDRRIGSIEHIWDNHGLLYPIKKQENWFLRKYQEYKREQRLRGADTIIVPSMNIGTEVVELAQVPEERIEIIPYLPLRRTHQEERKNSHISFQNPYWIYDGGYHVGANIHGLLQAFYEYKKEYSGNRILVLNGYIGESLKEIMHTINKFGLQESVKCTGVLSSEELVSLYEHAHGWIFTGAYYAGGPHIALAASYGLPLLLTTSKTFEHYSGIKIDHRHQKDIAQGLKELESKEVCVQHFFNEPLYLQAYERCLIRGK